MKLICWGNRPSKLRLKIYPKSELTLLRADFHFKPIRKTGS